MRLRSSMVLLSLSLLIPASADAAGAAPPELEKRFREFEEAFGAKDADKIGAMFVPDGTFINPAGERAEGREQVVALFRKGFETVLKGTRNKLQIQHVRMATPELAFVDIEQELIGGSPPPGAPRPWVAHGVVLLSKQGGGEWMVLEARPYFFVKRGKPAPGKRGPARAPAGG